MSEQYLSLSKLFHANKSNSRFNDHSDLVNGRLSMDSSFRTGITTDLGELFVSTPREMTRRIEHILIQERYISVVWDSFPPVMKTSYIDDFISESLFASNEMEGVRSTRKETQEAVKAARHGTSKEGGLKKFQEFASLYMSLTGEKAKLPESVEDIRTIYDKVALDGIDPVDAPDGDLFRTKDVEVIGPHGEKIHSGISGEPAITALLTKMLDLVESNRMPGLFSAIVAHFLFEYVHPFYDGNGRTGRYLLSLNLKKELSLPTVLTLTEEIADQKEDYYKAFMDAEDPLNSGELTSFVLTILRYIAKAQERIRTKLGESAERMENIQYLRDKISEEKNLPLVAAKALYGLMQEDMFGRDGVAGLESLSEYIEMSKQTTRKYMAQLEKLDLVAVKGKRPLKFACSQSLVDRMYLEGARE